MILNEKSIFNKARKIVDDHARDEYLRRACGDDHDALMRIGELLAEHNESTDFLESPPLDIEATHSMPGFSETIGSQIGPYKVLQEIGEGGMGTVYMAEQSRPVQRRVALKVIKAGMDSKEVVARFEAERQALAMMEHENIAKIFDAGTTEDGRPYFAMELVRGVPLTQFCDEKKLAIPDRLKLFVSICQAIQHAHQKGIIHRDIKPSNVMVSNHDGRAVPKIIDFGVAKAIQQKLTDKTLFTQFGRIVGTFQYMSPEQAGTSQLDIDTRSDIYSLGVLLYELLTGTTPIERKRVREAGWERMLQIIREEEPPKPSTKLSDSGENIGTISEKRGTTPHSLSSFVRGDLDWIVMKALEKDRTRRYETANGLSRDIQRHLSNDPVEARPPTVSYRLRKFISKNRNAVLTVASFTLLLLLGTILSTWLAFKAKNAAADARLATVKETAEREKAQVAEGEAKLQRESALSNLYIANMHRIRFEYENNNIDKARQLLDTYRNPNLDEKDRRGWEWYFLDRLCNSEIRKIKLPGSVSDMVTSPNGRLLRRQDRII